MKLRQARRCSCEIFVRLYIVTQQVCDPPLRAFYLSAAAARGAPRAILARVPSGDIPQCPRTLAESPLPRTFHSTETGWNSCLLTGHAVHVELRPPRDAPGFGGEHGRRSEVVANDAVALPPFDLRERRERSGLEDPGRLGGGGSVLGSGSYVDEVVAVPDVLGGGVVEGLAYASAGYAPARRCSSLRSCALPFSPLSVLGLRSAQTRAGYRPRSALRWGRTWTERLRPCGPGELERSGWNVVSLESPSKSNGRFVGSASLSIRDTSASSREDSANDQQ